MDELSGLNKIIEGIRDYIQDIHKNKKIVAREKDFLNMQFDLSGKEVEELCSFLGENCPKQISGLVEGLRNSYLDYWKVSTSNEVISSSVRKIDDLTFKRIHEKYTEVNQQIRRLKSRILKY